MTDKTTELTPIKITNESEAFAVLQAALKGELPDVMLQFENWPVLTIVLKGDGYDSTITSKMAEALVELQHALNRTYARAVYGTRNSNRLTQEDKSAVQFKAKVEKSSSLVTIDLGEFAAKLSQTLIGKMTSTELIVLALGTAAIVASTVAWKMLLKARSEDKKTVVQSQERIGMSAQETQRTQLITQAMTQQASLVHTQHDFDAVRQDILRSVSDADLMRVNGIELSNAEAKSYAATPRTKAEDVQLNGHYMITRVDWSNPEAARVLLASTDHTSEFIATLDTQGLTAEHRELLKQAEWERKRLHFSINATKLRGEVTTAVIVSVEWPKS